MNPRTVYNPKNAYEYKLACHKLMDQMWGVGKEGRALSYAWLSRKYKFEVHFSKIDDIKLLDEIWQALYLRSFRVRN